MAIGNVEIVQEFSETLAYGQEKSCPDGPTVAQANSPLGVATPRSSGGDHLKFLMHHTY